MIQHIPVFRRTFLLFTLAAACSFCSPKASAPPSVHQYTVSGIITQTHAYCGGARPSDKMLEDLRTPKPFPGKKLFVKNGTENTAGLKVLGEIIADSAGHFRLQLPPGSYCIVEQEQINKLDLDNFRKKKTTDLQLDEACLKQWWGKCLMSFEITTADKTDLNINFHFPCFTNGIPCMRYSGPLPP
jgi:hypothetical protein